MVHSRHTLSATIITIEYIDYYQHSDYHHSIIVIIISTVSIRIYNDTIAGIFFFDPAGLALAKLPVHNLNKPGLQEVLLC